MSLMTGSGTPSLSSALHIAAHGTDIYISLCADPWGLFVNLHNQLLMTCAIGSFWYNSLHVMCMFST